MQLVSTAAEQLGQLVRQEIALAQTELSAKAKRAGTGAGVLGGAGIVALYGLGALVAAAIIALGLALISAYTDEFAHQYGSRRQRSPTGGLTQAGRAN